MVPARPLSLFSTAASRSSPVDSINPVIARYGPASGRCWSLPGAHGEEELRLTIEYAFLTRNREGGLVIGHAGELYSPAAQDGEQSKTRLDEVEKQVGERKANCMRPGDGSLERGLVSETR